MKNIPVNREQVGGGENIIREQINRGETILRTRNRRVNNFGNRELKASITLQFCSTGNKRY